MFWILGNCRKDRALGRDDPLIANKLNFDGSRACGVIWMECHALKFINSGLLHISGYVKVYIK